MILYKVNGALYDVEYVYDQDNPTLQSPEESSLIGETGVSQDLTRRRINISTTSAFHQVGYYGPVVQATIATVNVNGLNLDSSQVTLVADYCELKCILWHFTFIDFTLIFMFLI